MKNLSSTQIRARLAEIEKQQDQHQARDFDDELKAVMVAGGDVDALEAQQLEAERVARRLRVERTALEGRLPEVEREEAVADLAALAKSVSDHLGKFQDAASAIARLHAQIKEHQATIFQIERERATAFGHALQMQQRHALPADVTAPFKRLKSSSLDVANATNHGAVDPLGGSVAWSMAYLGSAIEVELEA
jgi:chromosome segregation ATPase